MDPHPGRAPDSPRTAADAAANDDDAAVRAPRRIVSMLASGTELVCALGMGDRLVGRSHECDDPPWVKRLPVVSRPLFDVTGSSRAIDAEVRRRLHAGEPLYEVDEPLLLALAPDLLITQTHCEVCAVSPADLGHRAPVTLMRERVVALSTGTLDGILDGFGAVAAVLDRAREGAALVGDLRARANAVAETARALDRPTVVCLEWLDPLFAMGNWGPELVTLAGGANLLGAPGAHSTTLPWPDLLRADPEVLVVAPCGFAIERTLGEMPLLAALPGWRSLRAVASDRVFVADGNLYFNRSGPKVFETPEILAEMLHPEVFLPAHEGTFWRRWSRSGSSDGGEHGS
jgi:iron complex transport system substrate-binding protein